MMDNTSTTSMRLDAYLAANYPDTSRASFQKLIAAGEVKVNGMVMSDAKKNVSENDEVKVHFPHQKIFAKEIKGFAKNIIFENDDVVVVSKPAGMLTHMKGEMQDEFTVADVVKSRIVERNKQCHPELVSGSSKKTLDSENPEKSKISRGFQNDSMVKSNRPGIVHRLDRATSGVLIAAKNPDAAKVLAKQFSDRKAKKTYLAIVDHAPKLTAAKIDLPIGRNPRKPAEFKVDAKGKPAVTEYKTLATFADAQGNEKGALLELHLLTGRTHQLRVHLAYIGTPIAGDTLYNDKVERPRMFLHALALEITVPNDGKNERKIFVAPLPDEFKDEITRRDPDFNSDIINEGK